MSFPEMCALHKNAKTTIDPPGQAWRSFLSSMALTLRDATLAEADLIAWVQVEAARSGTPLGFWDLALPGADEPRLRLIAELAVSTKEHFAHVSGFLVAELDGVPVGALSGYAPAVKKQGHFVGALNQVLERNGWSEAHRRLLGIRILPAVSCFSDTPDDRWIVEWVAVRPNVRGKGVAAQLCSAILERGRAAGFRKAQISYLVGNIPAKRTYERAGFVETDGKRDAQFEAIFGAPGTVRMWMDL
jgi:ribosomal protein S18 acetylase RimI-like enzyme